MTYIDPDVLSDEGATAEAILAAIADQIEGWSPEEGDLETAIAEAIAMVVSTAGVLLKDEAQDRYSGFGERVLGIPRQLEQAAVGVTDWTMVDDAGYTIPDGTELYVERADGERIAFATVGEVTIDQGETVAYGVPIVALVSGPQANDIEGDVAWVDTRVRGVQSVTIPSPTYNGADAESIDDYADRLADRARRLRSAPITFDDYSAIALDVPGVERCLAVNLLDPEDPPGSGDPDSGGHVTVFPIDAAGEPVGESVAAAVFEVLGGTQSDRPLAVEIHVAEPTYTYVDADLTVWLIEGADESETLAAVKAAVEEHLSPATWGLDEDEPGRWRSPVDDALATVQALEVAHVARQVIGVQRVVTCHLGVGSGSGSGSGDEPTEESVPLVGFAPLPRPGVVTVAVAP